MIGHAPASYITGVPGWESPAEQSLLIRLAREVPSDGVIIEIGAEYGMSSSLLDYGANTAYIFTIEIDVNPAWFNNLGLYAEGRVPIPVMIEGESAIVGQKWSEISHRHNCSSAIDLLFIDGDHTYAGVKADIVAWSPQVRIGGKVAFHDTACATNQNPHPLHHEVSRAIDDWLAEDEKRWRFVESVDSIMVFERIA